MCFALKSLQAIYSMIKLYFKKKRKKEKKNIRLLGYWTILPAHSAPISLTGYLSHALFTFSTVQYWAHCPSCDAPNPLATSHILAVPASPSLRPMSDLHADYSPLFANTTSRW